MRAKAIVLVGLLLVSAGVVVAVKVHGQRLRRSAEELHIAEQLSSVELLLQTARRENLLVVAEAEFSAASRLVERANEALRAGQLPVAATTTEEASVATAAAMELARARVPVSSAAVVADIQNVVLYRRPNDVAWVDAKQAMNLYDNDRLATQKRSEALVRFSHGSEMRLEENSVLIVEQLTEARTEPTTDVSVRVDEGGFRSTVSRTEGREVRMSINLPQAKVVVNTAQIDGGQAEVGARVASDATNRVAVYSGTAELVVADGKKVVVSANELAEVAADGTLRSVGALPAAIRLTTPRAGDAVYLSDQRTDVSLRWQGSDSCKSYALQVARDQAFLDRAVDESPRRDRYTVTDLKAGEYHWRVSCLDGNDTSGPYSSVQSFKVVHDVEPPLLSVLDPDVNAVVDGPTLTARCRTESQASVFINGAEASRLGSGLFTSQVALQMGVNTLVFEAMDEAGNVVYNSRLVTRNR